MTTTVQVNLDLPAGMVGGDFAGAFSSSSSVVPARDASSVTVMASDSGATPFAWSLLFAYSGYPNRRTSVSTPVPAGPVTFSVNPLAYTKLTWSQDSVWASAFPAGLPVGTVVTVAGSSLPSGLAAATPYYVVSTALGSFSLSATAGGSAITCTSPGNGTFTVTQYNYTGLLAAATARVTTNPQHLPYPGGTANQGSTITVDDGGNPVWTASNTVYLDSFSGTDDQKMAAAITAVFATAPAGATIVLGPRAHVFGSQWLTSYVAANTTTAVRITGSGVAFNGAWGTPSASTVVNFTCTGVAACMDFQHNGSVEISGIQFGQANLGTPFFQTTNATPNIHDCVFSGGGAGSSCVTDAIVLGTPNTTVGGGDAAKYNAYQGLVYRNFFDGIRTCVLLNVATNSVNIHENTVSTSCGSGQAYGAPFQLIGSASRSVNDVQVWGNCVEVSNYPLGIYVTYAFNCTLGPNGFYDLTPAKYLAAVYIGTGASYNRVIAGFHSDTYPFVFDNSGQNHNTNLITNTHQAMWSVNSQPTMANVQIPDAYLDPTAAGRRSMDTKGNYAAVAPQNDAPNSSGYATVNINSGACTQITDAQTYNGSVWLSSASQAAFVSTDVGAFIANGNAGSLSFITAVAGPTTAPPWYPGTVQVLGDIVRPTAGNSHLYQCTTAGTNSNTQPTWPTGGGTVTDGSTVWQDLGTTATAALCSVPFTATGSAVTTQFGRVAAGSSRTLAKFARFHLITQGSAPALTADAGMGTGAGTISVTGTDHAFQALITSGGSTVGAGQQFHTTSSTSWITQPKVTVSAGNAATATLLQGGYYITVAAGVVTLFTTIAPVISTAYIFNFVALA